LLFWGLEVAMLILKSLTDVSMIFLLLTNLLSLLTSQAPSRLLSSFRGIPSIGSKRGRRL
jgi:hypothetical protein